MAKHEIRPEDIMDMADYAAVRKDRRRVVTEYKRNRRLPVGPDATFYFESYKTMLHQVHEMLFIEKGGKRQIAGELAAYNPLVPDGRELVATLMFEIDDGTRRQVFLARLGGVEEAVFATVDGDKIRAVPEQDGDRTSEEGKASSVQFLHFPFTADQIAKFQSPRARITVGIEHDHYGHVAIVPDAVRLALAEDFD